MAAAADWRVFASPQALADALAHDVADALAAAIAARGKTLLAVSGGSTPGRFFDALSKRRLDWQNVAVTLVDERFVPPSCDRSNEGLARRRLLVGEAKAARFVPLYGEGGPVEQAAARAAAALEPFGPAPDVAVLGMGTDGHTASFFPDADDLAALLDPASDAVVAPVHAASAGEPRLTLTLARLLDAGLLALHIEGEEKRRVAEAALQPGSRLPVSAVFRHSRNPVPVYWTG